MERRWRQIEGNVDRFISEEKTLEELVEFKYMCVVL